MMIVEPAGLALTGSMDRKRHHVHLVGIGGSGMSAIAWVLIEQGYKVSGSDLQLNELTGELKKAGALIFDGHAAQNIQGADVVVISSAIPPTNPELVAAHAGDVAVLKRADFLGKMMEQKNGIAVAGSHGKTTTTGMIAAILMAAGADPTVILGGTLPAWGRNGRAGSGDAFVIEADEYDHMFLGLRPQLEVITNVEHDHPDIYPTREAYLSAFSQFVEQLPEGGNLIACTDDPGVRELLDRVRGDLRVVGYGLTTEGHPAVQSNYRAMGLHPNQLGGTDFVVQQEEQDLGLVRLRVPGEHNVRNALAAIAVATSQRVPFMTTCDALADFGGVSRRFQVVGEVGDVVVVDDYAHHPTEIRATLAAARQQFPGRRLWAVWQPHTYSRTRLLLQDFAASFEQADRVIALDIYRSREPATDEFTTADVVARMAHRYVRHIGDRLQAATYILDRVRPGDVILTLGAGDGHVVGEKVLDGLRGRGASNRWS